MINDLNCNKETIKKYRIGDICTVITGGEPPLNCIKSLNPDEDHPYAIWGNGKEVYGFSNTYTVEQDSVVISSIGANTGDVYFREGPFTPIIRLKVVIPKDYSFLNPKYLYYALSAKKIYSKSSSVPNLNANEIKQLTIQVPYIKQQERIVNILDNFLNLSDLLDKELKLRKKQYYYYLIKVFNNLIGENNVPSLHLGDLINFINGRAYKQDELLNEGKYRVLRVGNFYSNNIWYYSDLELSDDKYCDKGDVLFSWAANIGPHIWNSDKTIFHYHIWKLSFDKNLIDPLYLYFFLEKDVNDMAKDLTQSTMPHISMANMKKRLFILPKIEEQREISRKLFVFKSYIENLEKEIVLRKKQYEYYRDKLLTFKIVE